MNLISLINNGFYDRTLNEDIILSDLSEIYLEINNFEESEKIAKTSLMICHK